MSFNIENVMREEVIRLLEQCTEAQRGVFKRCFPEGLDKLDEPKLKTAIDLCERTIKQNEKFPERVKSA